MKSLGINCKECLYGVLKDGVFNVLCHAPNNIQMECKASFNDFDPEMSYVFGEIPS